MKDWTQKESRTKKRAEEKEEEKKPNARHIFSPSVKSPSVSDTKFGISGTSITAPDVREEDEL